MSRKLNQVGDVLENEKLLGPGRWLVVSTDVTGGGSDHPGGHQITINKLHDDYDEIDWSFQQRKYHQSKLFTNNLPYIKPIENLNVYNIG